MVHTVLIKDEEGRFFVPVLVYPYSYSYIGNYSCTDGCKTNCMCVATHQRTNVCMYQRMYSRMDAAMYICKDRYT